MDVNIEAHLFTAMSYFYGGMLAIILFSITIFLDKKSTLPKYVGWLAFFEWLVFFAVLLWIGVVSTIFIIKDKPFH